MDYITIQDASIKWALSIRRIQTLCAEGRIHGAEKFGSVWAIPADADKPADYRIKSGRFIKSKKGHEQAVNG